jgi:hypothetical protein
VIEAYLSGFELLIDIFTCIELVHISEITSDEVLLVSLTGCQILGVDRGSEDERRAENKSEGDKNVELHNDRKEDLQ